MATYLTSNSGTYPNWDDLEAVLVSGDTVILDADISLDAGSAPGTLPAGVQLLGYGGKIVCGSHGFTISGYISAPGNMQLFTVSSGVIKLNTRGTYYAGWFPVKSGQNGIAGQWNTMIDAYTATSGNRIRDSYVFRIAPGSYTTSTGFDFTGMRAGTTQVDCFGAFITSTAVDEVAFDMTGSSGVMVNGLHIEGDATSEPMVGILCARDNRDDLNSSGKHFFSNCKIVGEFTTYGFCAISAEEIHVSPSCEFENSNAAGLGAALWTDKNYDGLDITSEYSGANASGPCYPGNGEHGGKVEAWAVLDVTATATSIKTTTSIFAPGDVGKTVQILRGADAVYRTINTYVSATQVTVNTIGFTPSGGEDVALRDGSDTSSSGASIFGLRAQSNGTEGALVIRGFDRVAAYGCYLTVDENNLGQLVFDTTEKGITACRIMDVYCHGDDTSPPASIRIKGILNNGMNTTKVTVRKISSNDDEAVYDGANPGGVIIDAPFETLVDCYFEIDGRRFDGTAVADTLDTTGTEIIGRMSLTGDDADFEQPIQLGAVHAGRIRMSDAQKLEPATEHAGMVETGEGVERMDFSEGNLTNGRPTVIVDGDRHYIQTVGAGG